MTNLQQILKEQEEEFDIFEHSEVCKAQNAKGYVKECFCKMKNIKSFIQSYNAKIIKAVCEEMTGKEENLNFKFDHGYNFRVQEEQEKAQELIKESENK